MKEDYVGETKTTTNLSSLGHGSVFRDPNSREACMRINDPVPGDAAIAAAVFLTGTEVGTIIRYFQPHTEVVLLNASLLIKK